MFILHKWSKVIFYIFVFVKHTQLFCNFVHKNITVIDIYAQKVKGIVFVDINIQVVKLDQLKQGCTQITLVQWMTKD